MNSTRSVFPHPSLMRNALMEASAFQGNYLPRFEKAVDFNRESAYNVAELLATTSSPEPLLAPAYSPVSPQSGQRC